MRSIPRVSFIHRQLSLKRVLPGLVSMLLLASCTGGKGHETEQRISVMEYARKHDLLGTDSLASQIPSDTNAASADERAQVATMVSKLCAEVLPEDGRIWFENAAGNTRWCACEELSQFNLEQLDTLRTLEHRRWRERARGIRSNVARARKLGRPHRRDTTAHHAVTGSTVQTFSLAPPPGAPADCFGRTFTFMGRSVTLGDIAGAVYRQYPIFRLECDRWPGDLYTAISDDVNLENAHDWVPADGELPLDERVIIGIPSALMDDPATEGELVLFFLLHEVGHVLGSMGECMPGWPMVCEGNADAWASYVGLRAVVPPRRLVRVGRAISTQFEAYVMSVDGAFRPCGYCIGCDDNNCGYPPLDCRLLTLRGGLTLDPIPDCTMNWFASQPAICRDMGDACSYPTATP
ncbi:MAG: hypothetical protein ABI432_06975 [Flavobacteriales bacterium]